MTSTTSLTPLYSLPCSLHRQIVLIARDAHGKRRKYLFTGNAFTETDCECCPVLEGLDDLQIRGTQGFGFQKSHWDSEGNQLICVGIEWDTQLRNTKERSGFLKYFVNSNGQLDIYEWSNEEFKATGKLQVQLETSGAQAVEALLFLGFLIVPVDLKDCQLHGIVMNGKNHIGITQQYRWNRYRDQLETIECSCQGVSLKRSDDGSFELLREQPDGVRVTIDRSGEIMKTVLRPFGQYQKDMDPTLIRDLKTKSPEELAIIESSDQKLADCFEKEQVEDDCWLLFRKERSEYSNDFLVEKCGRVFERLSDPHGPLEMAVANWQMANGEKDLDARGISVANLIHFQMSGLFKGLANTAGGALEELRDSSESPTQGPSDSDEIPASSFLAEQLGRKRGRGRPRKMESARAPAPNVSAAYEGSGRPLARPRSPLRSGRMPSTSGTWSNPLPLNGNLNEWYSADPFAKLKKRKEVEQEVPEKSQPPTKEYDLERNVKLAELVLAEISKKFSADERKKEIENMLRMSIVLERPTPYLPVTLTSEERAMIEKTLKDCRIALEFEEFQKKLVGDKKKEEEEKTSGAAQDFDWNDYELKSDDEGTVKGGDSDSEESDMDYDDSEDVKQMAPESVITRDDDDGCSVITDITDYSLLEEKE